MPTLDGGPQSHPDCERCKNRGRMFTPAEFSAFAPPQAPGPSIAERWGDEIADAAIDVDVLVEELDRVTNEWTAAEQRYDRAPRTRRAEYARTIEVFREERERVGERLAKARVRYNDLIAAASRQRQGEKYLADVVAQSDRMERERSRGLDRLRPNTKAVS